MAWKHLGGVLITGLCTVGAAFAQTLYDGSVGTLPKAQGWNYVAADKNKLPLAKAVQTLGPSSATVDTNPAISDSAGYFSALPPFFAAHPLVGALDRTKGFTVSFDSAVISETHSDTNRAGFSVIILASDLSGIELAFWENQIWAQDDGPNRFMHAESKDFDTKTAASYRLSINGQSYALSANGMTLLTGPLRNYTAQGTPYTIPSFIFLGDDTSRASAKFEISRIVLEKNLDPSMLEVVGFTQNGYQLKITGPAGPAYYLEASEDLVQWDKIQTLADFSGIATVTDFESVAKGARFYRARSGGNP